MLYMVGYLMAAFLTAMALLAFGFLLGLAIDRKWG
jgi:hypothetical protein